MPRPLPSHSRRSPPTIATTPTGRRNRRKKNAALAATATAAAAAAESTERQEDNDAGKEEEETTTTETATTTERHDRIRAEAIAFAFSTGSSSAYSRTQAQKKKQEEEEVAFWQVSANDRHNAHRSKQREKKDAATRASDTATAGTATRNHVGCSGDHVTDEDDPEVRTKRKRMTAAAHRRIVDAAAAALSTRLQQTPTTTTQPSFRIVDAAAPSDIVLTVHVMRTMLDSIFTTEEQMTYNPGTSTQMNTDLEALIHNTLHHNSTHDGAGEWNPETKEQKEERKMKQRIIRKKKMENQKRQTKVRARRTWKDKMGWMAETQELERLQNAFRRLDRKEKALLDGIAYADRLVREAKATAAAQRRVETENKKQQKREKELRFQKQRFDHYRSISKKAQALMGTCSMGRQLNAERLSIGQLILLIEYKTGTRPSRGPNKKRHGKEHFVKMWTEVRNTATDSISSTRRLPAWTVAKDEELQRIQKEQKEEENAEKEPREKILVVGRYLQPIIDHDQCCLILKQLQQREQQQPASDDVNTDNSNNKKIKLVVIDTTKVRDLLRTKMDHSGSQKLKRGRKRKTTKGATHRPCSFSKSIQKPDRRTHRQQKKPVPRPAPTHTLDLLQEQYYSFLVEGNKKKTKRLGS